MRRNIKGKDDGNCLNKEHERDQRRKPGHVTSPGEGDTHTSFWYINKVLKRPTFMIEDNKVTK